MFSSSRKWFRSTLTNVSFEGKQLKVLVHEKIDIKFRINESIF